MPKCSTRPPAASMPAGITSRRSAMAEAPNTTSLAGILSGTVTGPVARHAMLNRLGSVARPTVPLIPPVSARET